MLLVLEVNSVVIIVILGVQINKNFIKSSQLIFLSFLEYATVQGFAFISVSKEKLFQMSFWILAVCFLSSVGIFWSSQMYVNWVDQPVLTTIRTTAYSIKNVEFPAVTFCTKSTSDLGINASHITLFLNFLVDRYGIRTDFSPLDIAELLHLESIHY